MLTFLAAALALFSTATVAAPPAEPALYVVEVGGKAGFIDAKGRVVIAPRFDAASRFSDGLARVLVDGRYGFIDAKGGYVIAPALEHVRDFHEGLAASRADRDIWAFFDKAGKLAFQGRWDRVGDFHDGRAWAELPGRRLAYLERTGKVAFHVPDAATGDPADFREGLVAVTLKDRSEVRFYAPDGSIALRVPGKLSRGFSEGLAPVMTDQGWYYVDRQGQPAFDRTFEFAWGFREGLALVKVDGRQGFIDKTGRLSVLPQPPIEVVDGSLSEGLATVKVDGKRGWMDRTGALVIPARWDDPFDSAQSFRGGLAMVGLRSESGVLTKGYVDKAGKVVWRPSR